MSEYESNTDLARIAEELAGAKSVMVTTHAKPDGDALGSVAALAEALSGTGVAVECWLMPPVPNNLDTLSRQMDYVVVDADRVPAFEPDRIVVTDTGAWSQLDPLRGYLQARHERVIVIDHHLHGDEVGALRYVDSGAAAACEIIAELIDCLGVAFNALIAEALFIGIASDTGWFRFSNTTPRTHELAARLQRAGVDHAALFQKLEQVERPEKLALMIRALDSLKMVAGGKGAVMGLRVSDFDDTGARQEETERFVDVPQVVRDVQVVALVTEQNGGPTRISFRSKPGEEAVDVSALAQRFGGGGHARASGAKLDEPFDAVVERVIAAIEQTV